MKKNKVRTILKRRGIADIIIGIVIMLYSAETQVSFCTLLFAFIGFAVSVVGAIELTACKVQEDEESMMVR